MSFTTIILFFVYVFGLGYSISKLAKQPENFLERNLMRAGIGLGMLVVLLLLMNLLRIPLYWWIILVLSLIIPAYDLIKKIREIKIPAIKIKKSDIAAIAVLALFAFTLFMYLKGSFSYPYLEDDDPWEHARITKYIYTEKTAYEPELPAEYAFVYSGAYPPAYDAIMAILHQTSPSLSWTLKFFNALIISLGIIFFYFFAKEFIGNRNKALFAAAALTIIPCYLSHFIWAHALVVTLIFPIFYCLEKIKQDKKWKYIAAVPIAAMYMSQPTQPFKISVLIGIYFIVKWFYRKKFPKNTFQGIIYGLLIALLIWWLPALMHYGYPGILTEGLNQGTGGSFGLGRTTSGEGIFKVRGTADRDYSLRDFLIAEKVNMINNPIGIGIVLSLLVILGLITLSLKWKNYNIKQKQWVTITILWLLFTFLGVNGNRLPISFIAFRFWMLFAIPISLLSVLGLWFLFEIKKEKIIRLAILIIILLGLWYTSGIQKYTVNTIQWPPGQSWKSNEELIGYIQLKSLLPINSNVFSFSERHDKRPIGFDMYSCEWCMDIKQYRKTIINQTPQDIHAFLKNKNYEYAIIDLSYALEYGDEQTNKQMMDIINSNLFQPVFQNIDKGGIIIFKLA